MSGWNPCPSCQFLVGSEVIACPYCRTPLHRSASGAPVAPVAPVSSLPPPPPVDYNVSGWPDQSPGSSVRHVVLTVVAVIAAISLAAIAAVTILGEDADDRYAKEWDPRIEPLARFVEQERGLPFDHPVHVDFLTDSDFKEDIVDDVGPTDEERVEADNYAGLYRALGLMSGEIDLLGTTNDLLADGVAAYYSPETKRITVNGDLDADTRATVVHELTHAWQDQQYDLMAIEPEFDNPTHETYTAVIEGDATRIERRYYEQLPEAEQLAAEEGATAEYEQADYGRFPRALVAEFGAPYALGEPFVGIITELHGEVALDQAVTAPPASTGHLLEPLAYLDGEVPLAVEVPKLLDGEERFDAGTLGALFLYLVLNERMGPKEALAAVDGWAGDAYVAFTRDDRVCLRADVHVESPDALVRLGAAVQTWAAAMPAGSVQVVVENTVAIESCDPGVEAVLPPPVFPDLDPLLYPSARTQVLHGVLVEGADRELAECFTARYLEGITVEHLIAEDDAFAAELEALGQAAATACSAGS